MIPIESFTIRGKEMKGPTREFVNQVLLSAMNSLSRRAIQTRYSDLLGTGDVYVFRGTNGCVLVLSRSTALVRQRVAEIELSDVAPNEQEFTTDEPEILPEDGWNRLMEGRYQCVRPVSVIYPASFMNLEGDQLEEVQNKVAAALEPQIEKDVDEKLRIVRVNPIFNRRGFLVNSNLCFVLMEFKKHHLRRFTELSLNQP